MCPSEHFEGGWEGYEGLGAVPGGRSYLGILRVWYDGLARILTKVEDLGVWPEGLLDTYIAMSPKTDGDATHLCQRPLRVLPIVYRIWASARVACCLPTGAQGSSVPVTGNSFQRFLSFLASSWCLVCMGGASLNPPVSR